MLLLCVQVVALPAVAEPVVEEAAPPGDRARAHFLDARRAFQSGDYGEALRGFELAARLMPSAGLWYNIARCHEELDQDEQALEAYQHYLRDSVDPPDAAAVRERIAALRTRQQSLRTQSTPPADTGRLRIEAQPAGAQVHLDGRDMGQAPLDQWFFLAPGAYQLQVDRVGYVPFRARVDVGPGDVSVAYARLEPLDGDSGVTGRRVWTWVTAGVAMAALAAGTGMAVHASSQPSSEDLRLAADVTLVAAAGLAVLASILYFVEVPPSDATPLAP